MTSVSLKSLNVAWRAAESRRASGAVLRAALLEITEDLTRRDNETESCR